MSNGGVNLPRVEPTATTTSARVKIPFKSITDLSGNGIQITRYGDIVRVFSNQDVFIEVGDSSVIATTDINSTKLLKNNETHLPVKNVNITHIAFIVATGTAILDISTMDKMNIGH